MTRLFYKVHKWIGVGIGLIMLMWIVTGVLIGGGGGGRRAPVTPDYAGATVSPSAALAAAALGDNGITEARAVTLEVVAGRLAYRISDPKGRTALVDAGTGARIEICESLAREAAAVLAPQAGVREVVRLGGHDRGYPRGGLPAWRVILEDPEESWLHLSSDATTSTNTRAQRSKSTLHDLHTFAALQGLHLGKQGIRILLVLASVISVALVVTGYYLSLPKRWRSFRSTPAES